MVQLTGWLLLISEPEPLLPMVPLPPDFFLHGQRVMVHLLSATEARVSKTGSNASVPALWCWRIDNRVWGVPYQSMGALVIAPASASFVPALANQAYTILLCASCASYYGAVPSSGSTNETTASPSPVYLKVLFPPAPDSPSDAGRLIPRPNPLIPLVKKSLMRTR